MNWTTAIFGLACMVLAAERLAALRRQSLWAGLNAALAVERAQFSDSDRYFQAKRAAQIFKLMGGLACVGFSAFYPTALGVALLVTAGAMICDRRLEHVGGDGGDQQLRIVGVALAVVALSAHLDRSACAPGMIFLALQLLFCYGVAGIAKLATPEWRNGDALRCIAASDAFGSAWFRRVLGWRCGVAVAMSWAVMLFETLFPLAILAPAAAIAALALALGFHAGIAGTMRLNSFLWVFPISYPAFYYTSCQISRWLSGQRHF